MNEDPCKLSTREIRLQKAVAMGVNDYIQSKILALPKLPSEDMYKQLQEKRRCFFVLFFFFSHLKSDLLNRPTNPERNSYFCRREREREINEQKKEELTDAYLSSQIQTEFVHHKPVLSKVSSVLFS